MPLRQQGRQEKRPYEGQENDSADHLEEAGEARPSPRLRVIVLKELVQLFHILGVGIFPVLVLVAGAFF